MKINHAIPLVATFIAVAVFKMITDLAAYQTALAAAMAIVIFMWIAGALAHKSDPFVLAATAFGVSLVASFLALVFVAGFFAEGAGGCAAAELRVRSLLVAMLQYFAIKELWENTS